MGRDRRNFGFRAASAAAEVQREKAIDGALDRDELRSWLERLSSEPNQVGSPHDKANADFMLGKFREWGWDARIETFSVLYPTPKSELVELVAPTPTGPACSSGATAIGLGPDRGRFPYNVYGADGDVTADLIYVNFGMPEDYAELERRGLDVKAKIAIARYGAGWRGLKAKLAQEHGAVGCIIYSDPHEDGYWSGDIYPKGAYRPDEGVQRGSVADMTLYPGDPLTPGVGATADAKRLRLRGGEDAAKNTRDSDLQRRCPAPARRAGRPGRPRGMARRAPLHLPHRGGTGEGAPGHRFRLEPETDLRRDRGDEGVGLSGPVGHPRQPS